MPDFVYRGTDERTYYPPGEPAVHAVPGETYELSKDPGDGRWEKKRESAASAKAKNKPATETTKE